MQPYQGKGLNGVDSVLSVQWLLYMRSPWFQGLLFLNLTPTHIPASSLSTSAPDSRWGGMFFVLMPFRWNSCNDQALTLTLGSTLLWSFLWLILHRLDFSALLTSEFELWEPMLEVSYPPPPFPKHFPISLLSFLHMPVFLQHQILPSPWCMACWSTMATTHAYTLTSAVANSGKYNVPAYELYLS